jgi:amino acid transporter
MLFTAVCYGRMARAYPSTGSAYTYVGQEIHPALGYLTGWSMLMDYAVNPLICTIWCAKAALNILPHIPYQVWAVFFALLFTMLNLRRIQATARTNQILAGAMGAVVLWMLIATVRFVSALPSVDAAFFLRPFYDPATFSVDSFSTGASIAVLTYIGFDAISTLSEEVENPRRNVLLATVMVCLITGILSAVEVYAAQLVWPHGEAFPDVDTAYVHVAGRAGGAVLFQVVNLTLLVATVGSGSGAQLAGARLLYGMGRDGALPKSVFGRIDPRTFVPRNNVLILGGVALAGSFLISYQLGAELLNFGAFIGFMGVNAAALVRYVVREGRRGVSYVVAPAIGILICGYMWWSLRTPAKIAGLVWLSFGLLYGGWKTRGFRKELVRFEAPVD